MNAFWKNCLPSALVALVVAGLVGLSRTPSVQAEREAATGAAARYSVVETEAHNLIVTDNKTNTLFFYTIDKDKEVGSELKLRGTINLNDVGKATIKPTKPKSE